MRFKSSSIGNHVRPMVAVGLIVIFVVHPIVIQPQAQERVVALVNAKIIDGTGKPPLVGQTILIRGERIAAVGPKVKIPSGATVIESAGRSVIPGLIDMHGHMYARATPDMRSQFEAYPLLYLAGGVTTVRSPGDFEPEGMIALRERVKRHEATGPRIFTAGPYFDNDPSQVAWIKGVKSPEEALAQFNQWKGRLDWIKFYTRITESQMRVVLEAASKTGIPATGHLTSITATRAIELGINCLEHGIFAMSELVPERGGDQDTRCALGALDLDSDIVEKLVASIVKNRVAIDPTIVVFQIGHPAFGPVRFGSDEAGRTIVDVHQVIRDLAGRVISDQVIQHVYDIRNSLIRSMQIKKL